MPVGFLPGDRPASFEAQYEGFTAFGSAEVAFVAIDMMKPGKKRIPTHKQLWKGFGRDAIKNLLLGL